MREVIIVRGGALGDFILGLPLLDALRATYPDARFALIAPRAWLPLAWRPDGSIRPVALDDPTISAMYAGQPPRVLSSPGRSARACLPPSYSRDEGGAQVPALHGLASACSLASGLAVPGLADPCRVLPATEALLAKPDLVLLLFRTVEPLFDAAWRALDPALLLWYPALPEPGQKAHAVDHLLGVLDVLGLGDGSASLVGAPGTRSRVHTPLRRTASYDWTPRVWVGDSEAVATTEWLQAHGLKEGGPLVALHPGSGGRWKCWPAERFARVASILAERIGAQLLLVSGPADAEIVRTFHDALGETRVIEAASLPVRRLAAVLARCSLFIGNDSGVTHLAAAAGCPTLALFGPTDDRVWGPRGRHVTILRGVNAGASPPDLRPATWWRDRPPEPDLSVDTVLDAAFAVVARLPQTATRPSWRFV